MRDFRDAKAMAQTLRDTLKAKSVSLTHSESLEIVARTLGFHDWNVLAAAIQASQSMLASPWKSPIASPGKVTLMPVAPMRDVVFFPQTISPIWVGREKTRRAIEAAIAGDGRLLSLPRCGWMTTSRILTRYIRRRDGRHHSSHGHAERNAPSEGLLRGARRYYQSGRPWTFWQLRWSRFRISMNSTQRHLR